MKTSFRFLLIIMTVFMIVGSFCCSKANKTGPTGGCMVNGKDTCSQTLPTPSILLQLTDEKQTIQSFGASDCWTTKFIGNWANTAKKNLVADYLFSADTDKDGNPKGIALSMWRFNIGAGSYEQGAASGIPDEYRREECFLQTDGTYNWNKQLGQQWFLNAAKARGVNIFLGFTVSPPVQMTVNNFAYGLGNNQLNLRPDQNVAFVSFLTQVAKHFETTGTPFSYISPINEPQWNWGQSPSQEGTGATDAQIAAIVRLLGPSLNSAGVKTTIALGEANQWNSLDANNPDGRGDQLNQFFNKASTNYIGDVVGMAHLLSAHSYFTTCPDQSLITYRQNVIDKKNAIDPSLTLWQSEFGINGDICGLLNGSPRNVGIDYGLYVAKVIHHDLTITNVTSWQWWLGVDTYNYSDGLVYVNDPSGGYDLTAMKTDGIVSDSKQLWCFGNFSRFIRPGMIRVGATLSDIGNTNAAASSQMISAYKDPSSKRLVIVLINMGTDDKTYNLDSSVKYGQNQFNAYVTSATQSLRKSVINSSKVVLPGRSVTTLVGTYQ